MKPGVRERPWLGVRWRQLREARSERARSEETGWLRYRQRRVTEKYDMEDE